MSLPSYLSEIKSSGIYRFVWDKSEIEGVSAETLRLVVGYSEKGPFNTPVYIDTTTKFINTFGNISKKLEKRGIFFHRMALQALSVGPIICLNLKKFGKEQVVNGITFNNNCFIGASESQTVEYNIEELYDTTRFWNLEPANLTFTEAKKGFDSKYICVSAADSAETSNTIFFRGKANSAYDVTIKTWYSSVTTDDMPDYLQGYEDMLVSDFYAQIYVFKGQFTKEVVMTSDLKKYFTVKGDTVKLKPYVENIFGDKLDTLEQLANDENATLVGSYEGVLLPQFKGSTSNSYVSLDLLFNADYDTHKMMMYLDSTKLDDGTIKVPEIATIGLNNGLEALNNGMYNIININPDIVLGDWTGAEWSYTDSEAAHINIYGYSVADEVSGKVLTGDYDKWIAAGLAEGDRFLAADSSKGKLVTISSIEYDELAKTYTATFSDEPLVSDLGSGSYLMKFNHTCGDTCDGAIPLFLTGYPNIELPSLDQKSKRNWQDTTVFDALTDYQGIRISLTGRKDIEYHYIVDTFEAFVGPEVHAALALIAKEKENAVALLNFPAIKTFKDCTEASFTDKNGIFQTKYVKDGYNKTKPATTSFSLVSEQNGASYASYNTPVVITDGTIKTTVPAAALVSNRFMDKYTTRLQYQIVAGANYGKLTYDGLVGPDINFSRADLDILEPMGVNATVFAPRKGTYINSNVTAKQVPQTALSKLNVRELVIFLQDEIEALLESYHWELNTPALRATIKSKADTICELCKQNGGIYAYYNKCDDENNTAEVIDNEMIVLSTSIEPAKGAGKMVQELTLYKTGGLTSIIS